MSQEVVIPVLLIVVTGTVGDNIMQYIATHNFLATVSDADTTSNHPLFSTNIKGLHIMVAK